MTNYTTKENQITESNTQAANSESLSIHSLSNHPSIALQRIQSGRNTPLQMKQDIMILQRTIGNRAVVQLFAQLQKKGQASDTADVHNLAAAGVQGTGTSLPHADKIQAA